MTCSHPNWRGCGDLSGSHWSAICYGAKRKNLEVIITIEDAWQLFIEQNGRCALTGVKLHFAESKASRSEGNASLDRIDSSLGYIPGNCRWVEKNVNRLKNNWTDAKLLHWCRKIVAHEDSK